MCTGQTECIIAQDLGLAYQKFPTAPMYHPFFVFGGATTGAYVITSFPMGRLFAGEVDGEISERMASSYNIDIFL